MAAPMEFWGVEVKPGQSLEVEIPEGTVVHLSQASLGEVEKGGPAVLYVNVNGKKLAVGTLAPEKCTHINHDLVFEKAFTLSHTGKSGSVYFTGYRTVMEVDESDDELGLSDSDSDSDEELVEPVKRVENGKAKQKAEVAKAPENKVNAAKPSADAVKGKVNIAEPKKDDEDDDDDDSDSDEDDDDFDSEDDSDDEEMADASDDSDEEDDGDESSDEETPKKVDSSKKRPSESAKKTPIPEKKAKLVTPQKSGGDGKKGGGHTATPHPKKGGKPNADASAEKSKQTPKSASQVSCKACPKTFNSETALQSHSKAKHSGGK